MDGDGLRAAINATEQPPLPDDDATRRASVALVFRPGPDLLMIKRAEHPGDPWSGHMAFPGGGLEGSETWLDAAIRECREELDLRLEDARVLGRLRPVVGPRLRKSRPTIQVQPYVFWMPQVGPLTPNEEVAEVHWFALSRFLQNEGRATFPFRWRGQELKMPCHRLDGRTIWGMSLSMIDDLIDRVRSFSG